MPVYKYHEVNSGGYTRLSEKNYLDLKNAGWKRDGGLGDRPDSMSKEFESIKAAVEEWEFITGLSFWDQGCHCCGAPHEMSCDNPYEYVSGDSALISVSAPWDG